MLSGPSGQMMQTAQMEIDVGQSNVEDLELRAMLPFAVSGVIQYKDERAKPPGPRANRVERQDATAPESAPQVSLEGASGNGFVAIRLAEVQADGSFVFQEVQPGRYVVTLSWHNGYVKSMQLGPTSMDGRLLDVSEGAGGNALSIVVASDFAEISGRVDGGAEAAARSVVLLAPDPPEGPRFDIANVGPDGSFDLARLRPGKYKLAVVDKDNQSAFSVGGLEDLEDAIEIFLSPGERLTKNLKLSPAQ